ncbi:UPF0553 -like [Chlorella sorokiniana]|uniref:Queuosine 5'-phosphate N-glycosylase/hydrolase n=1 Tax=Chlorella sorokiniana TaxID=3076 RepID=A0A2P6THA9_CHLSO|nr:UPF0553 -like [Chlorella sorokiniana]|eukprot:PRW33671.1 UPF0553 -like [Chlorella sorokiniana]
MSGSEELNPCFAVRQSAEWVVSQAQLVTIDAASLQRLAASLADAAPSFSPASFDRQLHFWDPANPELVAQFLLVLDALNFCFWPQEGLEYEHLAGGLRQAVLADPQALDAQRLAAIDGPGVRRLLRQEQPLPLEEERARLLREVGAALLAQYQGQAANLIRAAEQSVVRLVSLVTAAFSGFRDHCLFRGRQLFFCKRAQIFVGDVWGAFHGTGLGCFPDIGQLTMFADYRVPVVLRELGVLRYAPSLAAAVDGRRELAPGSREEVEIRAATVAAVERLRSELARQLAAQGREAPHLCSVTLDWWLWEEGESNIERHHPHHRTLTIYY